MTGEMITTAAEVQGLPAECLLCSERPGYGPTYFVTFDCGDGVVMIDQAGAMGNWLPGELVDEWGPLVVVARGMSSTGPAVAELEEGGVLWAESGVSLFTGEPFVTLRWGSHVGQCSPDDARQTAMSILAAAEAAESDAAVVKHLRAIGVGEQAVGQFIGDLRTIRDAS